MSKQVISGLINSTRLIEKNRHIRNKKRKLRAIFILLFFVSEILITQVVAKQAVT